MIYKKGIRNYVNAKIRQIKRDFWESYTKRMERDFYGLHRMGIPQGARESIMNSYKGLSTTIQYSGSQREVSLLREVKQGDHLSPFIFNAIINSYQVLSTTIQYSASQREVSLLRGVKQGDHNEPPVGTVRTDGGRRD
jgi:hypothetical protein